MGSQIFKIFAQMVGDFQKNLILKKSKIKLIPNKQFSHILIIRMKTVLMSMGA